MTIQIPVWGIVTLLVLLPFVVALVVDWGTYTSEMSEVYPIWALGAFLVTAGVCWTGLIVWAVMR